jgi:hypothetical protein
VTRATKTLPTDGAVTPEATDQQDNRITPALWMPAAPTIAWLTFSSAETDWDAKFYFGASIWYAAAPERVLDWLHEVEQHGDLLEDFQPYDFQHLHRHVRDAAAQTASFQAAKAEWAVAWAKVKATRDDPAANRVARSEVPPLMMSDDQIREAARTLRADLESKLEGEKPAAKRDYHAIWEGSEKLRRALARGNLTACGWPGRGPDFSDNANPPLREPIPRDVFSRPVTVTQAGVFAFARGDGGIGYDFDVLWSGLLFDSADLLALNKPPEDDRPTKRYTPPEKPSRKGIGGRPDVYDWGAFDHALIRQLVREALNLSRLKIRKDMKDWAAEKMGEHPPDDSTIERHIDRLVPTSVYVK